ncbi:hypothetical protein NUW54_g3713 [Trametes sanguinea]|uniref:Uncharacterized protein n=1 Tax=Trametes sanguinea TaxID=158606 RepID=A0ACC1Q336_9APHY|nr:hypothetical protein NUW54_g3713 [Trametes sanguinea]
MDATHRPKLKTAFKKARVIAPLHTAGPVAATPDGSKLVTCVGEDALLTDVKAGVEICRFAGDTESITSLCITPSSSHLLLFTSSLSLRIYEIPKSLTPQTKLVKPIRVVARAHDAPVHVCKADPTSTYLASGSADGVVKVWDILRGYVTHLFKGHGGMVIFNPGAFIDAIKCACADTFQSGERHWVYDYLDLSLTLCASLSIPPMR